MTNLNEKTKRIGTEVSTKNFEKSLKNILTDCLKNGKIIKLSGRHAGTKTTIKRQWLAWKWTEKAPRKVKKSS